MKKAILPFTITALMLSMLACKNEGLPEVKTIDTVSPVEAVPTKILNPNATYAKAEFGIEGMTCAMGCAKAIEKKIAKMDGIKSAKVDFDRELAMVEYDDAIVTPVNLEETVKKAGDSYKVKNMKTVTAFSSKEN